MIAIASEEEELGFIQPTYSKAWSGELTQCVCACVQLHPQRLVLHTVFSAHPFLTWQTSTLEMIDIARLGFISRVQDVTV